MEFEIIKPGYFQSDKCLGNAVFVVIPTRENAPDFVKEKFKNQVQPSLCMSALGRARTLAEAEQAINEHLGRIEQSIRAVGWGCIKVKIGKGASPASVKAKLECWAGETPPSGRPDERKKVVSEFYAPASAVMACQEKGYGLLNQFFVIKKLEEVAARSQSGSRYKRVPVAPAICPPGVLEEVKKRMMAQLPTQEALEAQAAAALLLESERQAKIQEREKAVMQRREIQAAQAASNVIRQAAKADDRKNKLAAMETHKNVSAHWHNWAGTSKNRVKIERDAEGVDVHISGARAYVVFPDGEEIIVATKNLQFHSAS